MILGDELRATLFRAGIRTTEAAQLFVVSRHAIYGWYNGIKVKNELIRANTARLCTLIIVATEKGLLPLPEGTPRTIRMQLIKEALKKVHRSP